jgi:uncharacterized membrane protein
MEGLNERIAALEARLQEVIQHQETQNAEILSILRELQSLKVLPETAAPLPIAAPVQSAPAAWEETAPVPPVAEAPTPPKSPLPPFIPPPKPRMTAGAWEDAIGRNLISRIGILVLVIGMFIGVKYAIDKDLISPLVRIVLGYLMAGGLGLLALYLRPSYKDYSAVLMSGAVVAIYFLTYIGYDFYQLFPRGLAFALMFAATLLSVGMALWYDNRFIALQGQVGAYTIPFLLSTGGGNILLLLGYMCVVNTGLLVLSFRKAWRELYQLAFYTSWGIYLLSNPWQLTTYGFAAKMVVLTAQMGIFYAAFLSYKLLKKEEYSIREVLVLLLNALVYFAVGLSVVKANTTGVVGATVFTLLNALLHGALGWWLHRKGVADKRLPMFVVGLGITFLTVAVPVAFKGSTITIFWAAEALVLAFIARKAGRGLYLTLSNALLVLLVVSLLMDVEDQQAAITAGLLVKPFLHPVFFSSLLAVAAIGGLAFLARRHADVWEKRPDSFLRDLLPLLFIVLGYGLFYVELEGWWDMWKADVSFQRIRVPALQLYTFVYILFWVGVNRWRLHDKRLSLGAFFLIAWVTFIAFFEGLSALGNWRTAWLADPQESRWLLPVFRYAWMIGLLAMQWMMYGGLLITGQTTRLIRTGVLLLNLTGLVLLGNEFVHWMDVGGYQGQYRLGLSIISGLYALSLVAYGILKNRQYLRIAAIGLLAITLLKVFLYDLAALSTISKTLVLISLGVILLIASFLYTRFREKWSGHRPPTDS